MKGLITDQNDVSGNATVRWGNVDLGDTKSGTANSPAGITPENIAGQFDDSYKTATGGYAPFTGDHSKIDQLQSLYGTVGEAFDVSGTVSALDKSRRTNLLTGEAAANDAASKYQETQGPGIQSGTGASVIRARSLLPFLQADTAAAADTGKYVDTAKQNALKTGADIASSLAQLEQSYTNSLASYNSDKANFGLNFAKGETSASLSAGSNQNDALRLGLQAQAQGNEQTRFMQQQAEAERQRQTALRLARSQAAGASSPSTSGMYFINTVGQRVTV